MDKAKVSGVTDEKIRVLIIDDSSLRRDMLKSILESEPSIEVIGFAKDGKEGVEKAISLKPNVITMDLQMPVMGGISATEKIMQEIPTPIIVVSSMDVQEMIKALGFGAVDFIPIRGEIEEIADDLIDKVKIASKIKTLRRIKIRPVKIIERPKKLETLKVVAIGISTGGPPALQAILSRLPHDFPAGVLIVQHMSRGFIQGLAEWLRFSSHLDIRVAITGDVLKSSTVLFAPDDCHTKIDSQGRIIFYKNEDKSILHVPSIDIMMKSAADSFGRNAIGVIMTGMGHDGVEGIKAIKNSGGRTIAQDEKTSVIFGMNKVAIDTGCVEKILPLEEIAGELMSMCDFSP